MDARNKFGHDGRESRVPQRREVLRYDILVARPPLENTDIARELRHGGNATRTADALYLHRNSLRYRLARIQALTGLDPDDPDARLALQIAITIPMPRCQLPSK